MLDGEDGAAPGFEHARSAALAAIDSTYAAELAHGYNADVGAPLEVQEFWKRHGALPGFSAGT